MQRAARGRRRRRRPRPHVSTVTAADQRGEHEQREQERARVLVDRRAVVLDAVDSIDAADDLSGGGGRRDQRAAETDEQRQGLVLEADLLRLRERPCEQAARRSRHGLLDAAQDRAAETGLTEIDGQPDQGHQSLHHDQREGVGQRPRVAEAVSGAQTAEGVADQADMAGGREGVPGVIARELARLAHAARDAHDARWPARAAVARAAPGAHTRSAPGSTRTLIRFVRGRAPPSSS